MYINIHVWRETLIRKRMGILEDKEAYCIIYFAKVSISFVRVQNYTLNHAYTHTRATCKHLCH